LAAEWIDFLLAFLGHLSRKDSVYLELSIRNRMTFSSEKSKEEYSFICIN